MKKTTARFIEVDLIVILAVVVLLGIVIGYSMAAGKSNTSTDKSGTTIMKMSSNSEANLE